MVLDKRWILLHLLTSPSHWANLIFKIAQVLLERFRIPKFHYLASYELGVSTFERLLGHWMAGRI